MMSQSKTGKTFKLYEHLKIIYIYLPQWDYNGGLKPATYHIRDPIILH